MLTLNYAHATVLHHVIDFTQPAQCTIAHNVFWCVPGLVSTLIVNSTCTLFTKSYPNLNRVPPYLNQVPLNLIITLNLILPLNYTLPLPFNQTLFLPFNQTLPLPLAVTLTLPLAITLTLPLTVTLT